MDIEGARLIGETWHYHKRIPKRLRDAYALPEFKRGSMKTKDPDTAKTFARAMLTELDELAAKLDTLSARMRIFGVLSPTEQAASLAEADANVAALPVDQRQLIRTAGGVFEAGRAMHGREVRSAFITAGQGAEFDLMDDLGEKYDTEDREDVEAQEAASAALHSRKGAALRDALTAAKVIEPDGKVTDLRDVLERFCKQKEYLHTPTRKNKTSGQYEYALRRFVEYVGPVPLADLSRRHIAGFADDFLRLPTSFAPAIRALPFWEAIKVADDKKLPRVIARTRDQNLVLIKSLMTYAVKEELRPAPDPWSGYAPTTAKEKVSDRRKRKPHVFTRDEMRSIIALTTVERHHDTIDYWGPLLGAHHGMRIEEYCQARAVNGGVRIGHWAAQK